MLELLPQLVDDDPRLIERGRLIRTSFLAVSGPQEYLFEVRDGRLSVRTGSLVMPQWSFALRAEPAIWQAFWQPLPEPGLHDIIAMMKFRTMKVEGDLYPLMTNLLWFKDVLAKPRAMNAAATTGGN